MTFLIALSTANAADIDMTIKPDFRDAPGLSDMPQIDSGFQGKADCRMTASCDADAMLEQRVRELEGSLKAMARDSNRQRRRILRLEDRLDEQASRTDALASRIGDAEQRDAETDARMGQLAAAIQDLTDRLHPVWELMEFVVADGQARTVEFIAANVYIRSGSGVTMDGRSGLGNLILGYDEADPSDRKTGSHNLIVGPAHSYDGSGMVVAGADNIAEGEGVMVAGQQNAALGAFATVVGGRFNTAQAPWSAVLGGEYSAAIGEFSSVLGGEGQSADGPHQVAY